MEKTIRIDEKNVRLSNNVGWTFEYRDQFGKDIVPVVMPLVASVLDLVSGLVRETGKTKEIDIADVIALMDEESITNALIHLSGLEFTDFVNVLWSMAKCVDDSIEEPKVWVRQFDTFPLDEIAPPVFELIVKGLISTKNLERLKMTAMSLRP